MQQPQWGQPQRRQPVYQQYPGGGQYRPLDGNESRSQSAASPPPQARWSVAPYDRLGGSSFGSGDATRATPAAPVYGGGYPGYPGSYGAYGYPGTGALGWPGGYGYPGSGWPLTW
jgi:hypothetical protein